MNDLLTILCAGSKAILRITEGFGIGMFVMFAICYTIINNQSKQLNQAKTCIEQADSIMSKHDIWDADGSDLMERYCTNADKVLGHE